MNKNHSEQYSFRFYRYPQAFVKDPQFKIISNDAKLLYVLLLSQIRYAVLDDSQNGNVRKPITCPVKKVSKTIGCSQNKACKLLAELQHIGLIDRHRHGQGHPSDIYLKPIFPEAASDRFAFYRYPVALIKNNKFKTLSNDAKLLYTLLLDRMQSSARNDFRDKSGRVHILYSTQSVSEDIGCSQDKSCKLMTELEQAGLIERYRQGQGKPSRIYVKFGISEITDSADTHTKKSDSSPCESRILEVEKVESNHINQKQNIYNHIYQSSSDVMEEIKEQLAYDLLLEHNKAKREIIDMIVNVIAEAEQSASPTLRISGNAMPKEQVIRRLRQLEFTHVEYVLDCMKESRPEVRNIKAYLLTSLYHAPDTMDAYYQTKVIHDGVVTM